MATNFVIFYINWGIRVNIKARKYALEGLVYAESNGVFMDWSNLMFEQLMELFAAFWRAFLLVEAVGATGSVDGLALSPQWLCKVTQSTSYIALRYGFLNIQVWVLSEHLKCVLKIVSSIRRCKCSLITTLFGLDVVYNFNCGDRGRGLWNPQAREVFVDHEWLYTRKYSRQSPRDSWELSRSLLIA